MIFAEWLDREWGISGEGVTITTWQEAWGQMTRLLVYGHTHPE